MAINKKNHGNFVTYLYAALFVGLIIIIIALQSSSITSEIKGEIQELKLNQDIKDIQIRKDVNIIIHKLDLSDDKLQDVDNKLLNYKIIKFEKSPLQESNYDKIRKHDRWQPLIEYDSYTFIRCDSQSMGMVMMCGDLLLLKNVTTNDSLEIGKVYIYNQPDSETNIVHRLIGCKDNECKETIFKGDNNEYPEVIERNRITHQVVGNWYGWE